MSEVRKILIKNKGALMASRPFYDSARDAFRKFKNIPAFDFLEVTDDDFDQFAEGYAEMHEKRMAVEYAIEAALAKLHQASKDLHK